MAGLRDIPVINWHVQHAELLFRDTVTDPAHLWIATTFFKRNTFLLLQESDKIIIHCDLVILVIFCWSIPWQSPSSGFYRNEKERRSIFTNVLITSNCVFSLFAESRWFLVDVNVQRLVHCKNRKPRKKTATLNTRWPKLAKNENKLWAFESAKRKVGQFKFKESWLATLATSVTQPLICPFAFSAGSKD